MPRTRPSELTISVTTRPQPPCRLTSRRKAVSVIPAIGATTNGDSSETVPIFTKESIGSIGSDIGRIDLNAHSLSNQVDREHESGMRTLANETADDTRQSAVDHFDHHAFVYEGAGIVLKFTRDERTDAVDFVSWDWR